MTTEIKCIASASVSGFRQKYEKAGEEMGRQKRKNDSNVLILYFALIS
jgi:hypothetical protein